MFFLLKMLRPDEPNGTWQCVTTNSRWYVTPNFTLDFKHLGFTSSSRLWDFGLSQNVLSSKTRPLLNSPGLFLRWPGKMLTVLSLVQEWRDASVVILDMLTPVLARSLWSSYILELTFLVNLFEAVVIPVASAPFFQAYLYLPADLPLICVYTSLWTARFFSNQLDWEIHSNYAVLIVSYLMIYLSGQNEMSW